MERPRAEEIANASTHAFGIALSLIGSLYLSSRLIQSESIRIVWIACGVYMVSLLGVYVSSTCSHLFTTPGRQKMFRKLDQAFIYLLIVGSYTPFSVAYLDETWWWVLLGAMWTVAIIGFVSKIVLGHRLQTVSIWLYLLLGWMPAMGGMPFTDQMPWECILCIVAGGVTYTLGTIFLFNDKRVPFFHAVWHLFVIAGSVIHFLGLVKFVS